MAEFFVSDKQLKDIVAAGLADSISPEKKEELFQQALVSVMQEERDSHGRPQASILQRAFSIEVEKVVREEVQRIFKEDESIRDQVKEAVIEALHEAFDKGLSGKMAYAISRVFEEK